MTIKKNIIFCSMLVVAVGHVLAMDYNKGPWKRIYDENMRERKKLFEELG